MKTHHDAKPNNISTIEIFIWKWKKMTHSYVISMSGDCYRDLTEYQIRCTIFFS